MATMAVVGLFMTLGAIAFLAMWRMGPPPLVAPERDATAARDNSDAAMPQSESRAPMPVADRVAVPAALGTSQREKPTSHLMMGSLTPRGRDALLSHLESGIEKVQTALDARMSAAQADGSLGGFDDDLELVARLELMRARSELVRDGIYITIPLSGTMESVPSEPAGVVSMTTGPFEVEGGKWAQVMLWVK